MSSCRKKDGKHSKSVLNLRVTIIFFGNIQIKANTLLGILIFEPEEIVTIKKIYNTKPR